MHPRSTGNSFRFGVKSSEKLNQTNKQRIFQNTNIDYVITVKLNTTLGRTKPFEG